VITFDMGAVKVILFDVNETLLDLRALDPFFGRVFGAASTRERWFKELECLWLVTIATGQYKDFTKLARAALEITAQRDGVDLSEQDAAELLGRMVGLPPHQDVVPALERLKGEGLRLAALSNGTVKSVRAQLQYAELTDYFEQIFSVDDVERYKPAPEPYRMAANRLVVKPEEVRMVAAHAWDISGAHAAGLNTAFVHRPGKVLSPLQPEPGIRGSDLLAVAEEIVHADG
jgi:2-haloacid dehalogenase